MLFGGLMQSEGDSRWLVSLKTLIDILLFDADWVEANVSLYFLLLSQLLRIWTLCLWSTFRITDGETSYTVDFYKELLMSLFNWGYANESEAKKDSIRFVILFRLAALSFIKITLLSMIMVLLFDH